MISDRRYIFFCRNLSWDRKYNQIMIKESDGDDMHLYEVRLMLGECTDTGPDGADLIFSSLKMSHV